MDYRTADPHLPPPQHHHHHLQHSVLPQHQPPLETYSYPYSTNPYSTNPYPNPNPNPNPVPVPSSVPADGGILRPPGVNQDLLDPYAPHGGYEGHNGLAYTYPPVAMTASYYHGAVATEGVEGQCTVHPIGYGVVRKNVKRPTNLEDLETKKYKLIKGGAAVDSMRVCSTCSVVCNSDAVFASHLAGAKHALKALGRSSNGLMPAGSTPVKPHKATNAVGIGSKKIPKVVQCVYCEVCKLACNSQDVLNMHEQGKKHKKNLLKLQGSVATKTANASSSTAAKVTAITDKGKTAGGQHKKIIPDDLETKKRKILDSGTALDAVRVCTVCNVACNSQTVFDSHMAGQKHAAMVKQQLPAPDS